MPRGSPPRCCLARRRPGIPQAFSPPVSTTALHISLKLSNGSPPMTCTGTVPLGTATLWAVDNRQPSGLEPRTKVVGYVRVSSNDQAERGTIEQQRADIRAWAKRQQLRIVEICEDEAVSGAKDVSARPGLACAVDHVEKGQAAVVVFAKLDRLARDLLTQEATLGLFWRAEGRVFTLDQGEVLADDPLDPIRTAFRQILGVFGQLERAMIRARMERGRMAKAQRGGYTGGAPPFGFQKDITKELVTKHPEQAVVDRILADHAAGASIRSIAAALNDEGVPTKIAKRRPNGSKEPMPTTWHPATVARIVKRAQQQT